MSECNRERERERERERVSVREREREWSQAKVVFNFGLCNNGLMRSLTLC